MNALSLNQLAIHHSLFRHDSKIWKRQAQAFALTAYRIDQNLQLALPSSEDETRVLRVLELSSRPINMRREFCRAMAALDKSLTIDYVSLIPPLRTDADEPQQLSVLTEHYNVAASEDTSSEQLAEQVAELLHRQLQGIEREALDYPKGHFHFILLPDLALSFVDTPTLVALFPAMRSLLTDTGSVLYATSLPLSSETAEEASKLRSALTSPSNYYMSLMSGPVSCCPNDSGLLLFPQDETVTPLSKPTLSFAYSQQTAALSVTYTNADVHLVEELEGDSNKDASVVGVESVKPFTVDLFLPNPNMVAALPTAMYLDGNLTLKGTYFYPVSPKVKIRPDTVLPYVPSPQRAPVSDKIVNTRASILHFTFPQPTLLSLVTPPIVEAAEDDLPAAVPSPVGESASTDSAEAIAEEELDFSTVLNHLQEDDDADAEDAEGEEE